MIHQRLDKVRVVLIAGPSSSGKTSFANRLCIQLQVLGIQPHKISLDDYFVERDKTPVDENGKRNYEHIQALDLPLLNDDLKKMIAGELVDLPTYNFVTGKREYNGNRIQAVSYTHLDVYKRQILHSTGTGDIRMSPEMRATLTGLRAFMFQKVYHLSLIHI